MRKHLQRIMVAIFISVVFFTSGCEDHRERYETPPWLGGSNIEILEQRGNYSIFLELMEQANYTEPVSKQLFTLFVPNDDAFREYFNSVGIESVSDLSRDEAVNLFTLHVLRNPRSRFQLIYEWFWDELQGPTGEYAALYHRKPTPSTSIPYLDTIKYVTGSSAGSVGSQVWIYTQNKNVPLWTSEWFGDYGGERDGSDYLFMYPGSKWEEGYTPNLKGMNWHNAMVIPNPEIPDELEVRTASGFIYFLDRVVPVMPSIEEYLKSQPKYSLFYDLMQRFARFHASRENISEGRRIEYRKGYDLIFDLASEVGPSTNQNALPQNMFTAFIPSNQVLQNYLDNTVLNYYASIDEVPRATLFYILQSQLSATLAVPAKMERFFFNAFGDPTDITRDDIASSYMASNGVVYEMKRVLEPNVFTTVPGLLFFDKNYSTLLYVLNQAGMLSSLSNPDSDVTLFATDNDNLEEYGIRYDETSSTVQFRGPIDGQWRAMNTNDLLLFAQDQFRSGKITDLGGPGGFVEMASGNFMYYGDNKLEAAENQRFDRPSNVEEVIVNERNGLLVKVDYPVASRLVMGQRLIGPLGDPDVSEFADLLVMGNFLDSRYTDGVTRENIPLLRFLSGNRYWTAFIPTNEAVAKAKADGIIPETYPPASDSEGRAAIEAYIKYHFLPGVVIFDDGKISGSFNTNNSYRDPDDDTQTINTQLTITNSPNNLVIEDLSGQVITLNPEDANFLTRRGVMHKINTVLNPHQNK